MFSSYWIMLTSFILGSQSALSQDFSSWWPKIRASIGEGHAVDSGYYSDFRLVFLDATFDYKDTNSQVYNQHLLNILQVGLGMDFEGFGLRLATTVISGAKSTYPEDLPRKVTVENWTEIHPEVLFVYTSPAGIEFMTGFVVTKYANRIETSESASFESEWIYQDVSLLRPIVSVIKSSSDLTVGFYYLLDDEKNREIQKTLETPDVVLVNKFQDTVYQPRTFGILVNTNFFGLRWLGEFVGIEAGGGGVQTSLGNAVYEDHLLFRVSSEFEFYNLDRIRLGWQRKTHSYASNRNVTLDSLSHSTLNIKWHLYSLMEGVYVGILYGLGRDGQSIKEFNAVIKTSISGIEGGLNILL